MAYLARYKGGEYRQVWEELLKLGPEIRQGDLYVQAEAVARETMRRVKANLETLVERLKTLNYDFKYSPLTPLELPQKQKLEDLDQKFGPLPLSLKIFFEEVGSIDFMGSHPKLSEYDESNFFDDFSQNFSSLYQKHFGSLPESTSSMDQSVTLSFQLMQELTRGLATNDNPARTTQLNTFTNELIAQYSGTLNAYTKNSKEDEFDVYSDPIVAFCDLSDFEKTEDELEDAGYKDPETDLYILEIAPDPIHKAHYSGGGPSFVLFPNFGIDGEFRGDGFEYGYFVEYLRECFQWGGFPGLKDSRKPPRKELDFLTRDLLPI